MKPLRKEESLSLLELLVAIGLLSLIVLSFSGIHLFSHSQLISAERRTLLQNELSHALEHMGKTIEQAVGYTDRPPFSYIAETYAWGFRVWTDPQHTPNVPGDDVPVDYLYTAPNPYKGNVRLFCRRWDDATVTTFTEETLSTHLAAGGTGYYTDKPIILPPKPNRGFNFRAQGYTYSGPNAMLEVALVGRYDPSWKSGTMESLPITSDNPQVTMRVRFYARQAPSTYK